MSKIVMGLVVIGFVASVLTGAHAEANSQGKPVQPGVAANSSELEKVQGAAKFKNKKPNNATPRISNKPKAPNIRVGDELPSGSHKSPKPAGVIRPSSTPD